MALLADDRAQSIQVGAVLLFAILILAFSTYQAVIVPEQNRRVEFDHNQNVQSQLSELRDDIIATQDGGAARSTTIDLGTRYPSRAIALNPSSPSGTLRTVGTTDPLFNLTIDNATASGETGDVWNGTARSYNTGSIEYVPVYHNYDDAPTTRYEHTVLYNNFSADSLVLANQSFIQGDQLSLVTLNGSLQRTSSAATTVDTRPLSASDRTILVDAESANDPITLNFTSRLSVDRWRTILSGQDNVVAVDGYPSPAGEEFTAIRVELATGVTYEFELTKAGIGTGLSGEEPAYLTDVAGDGGSVSQGNNQEITLEVRDAYNNPIPSVTVNGTVPSNEGALDTNQRITDADGQVTFTYETSDSTATGTHAINFTLHEEAVASSTPFDSGHPKNVSVSVNVTTGAGGGGSSYQVTWRNPAGYPGAETSPAESCAQIPCGPLDVRALTTPAEPGKLVTFYSDNSTVATMSTAFDVTDADGRAEGALELNDTGVAGLHASNTSGSDTIYAETYLNSGFESATGDWTTYGTFQGSGDEGRTTDEANQGSWSFAIPGGNDGGMRTAEGYNTSEGELVLVEYWTLNDGAEAGEGLELQYLSDGGDPTTDADWVTVDSIAGGSIGTEYNRRARIDLDGAMHENLHLRFNQETADFDNDVWYVDDVRFTVLSNVSHSEPSFQPDFADPQTDNGGATLSNCDGDDCDWDPADSGSNTLTLRATTTPQFIGQELSFSVDDPSVATVSPTSATTDSNGEATTTLTAQSTGTVEVTVSGGGNTEEINVTVQTTPPAPSLVYNDDANADQPAYQFDPAQSMVSFTVTNQHPGQITIDGFSYNSSSPNPTPDITEAQGAPYHEVWIDTNSDGTPDGNQDGDLAAGDANVALDDNADLTSGSTAEVRLYHFESSQGGGSPQDMVGEDATVALHYTDSNGDRHTTTIAMTNIPD